MTHPHDGLYAGIGEDMLKKRVAPLEARQELIVMALKGQIGPMREISVEDWQFRWDQAGRE